MGRLKKLDSERNLCALCGERFSVSRGLCQRCYTYSRRHQDIKNIDELMAEWKASRRAPADTQSQDKKSKASDSTLQPARRRGRPRKNANQAVCVVCGIERVFANGMCEYCYKNGIKKTKRQRRFVSVEGTGRLLTKKEWRL